ncbi:MAG: hypothetical protein ACRD3J_05985 [Thermoanaerobaculia bacterium]
MTEFRSRQPLNDDDFAAIRRNVMSTIAARRERRLFPIVMRFALAAVVVIAIGVALIPRHPGIRETQQPSNVVAKHNSITHQPIIQTTQLATSNAATRRPGNKATQQPTHRPRHHHAPQIELAKQNIRVEFRTSDPDVRIIWIASQNTNISTGGKS